MAVYVDNARIPLQQGKRVYRMCHMFADTRAELFAMVDKLGIPRGHIQKKDTAEEHFDVSYGKKLDAVTLHGAIEVRPRELVMLVRKKREALGNGTFP